METSRIMSVNSRYSFNGNQEQVTILRKVLVEVRVW